MNDKQLREETYSLIFMSLRHPLRRRILRMLADHPSTFSEILDSISVDSGHLSYHLENLGELIRKPQDGKYELSSIGVAAVRLMSGVEEHQAHNPGKESRVRLTFLNVFVLILVGALMGTSFFFVNFTMAMREDGLDASPVTVVHVRPSQAFVFRITLVYSTEVERVVVSNESLYHERRRPISTFTFWEEGYFWFDLTSNATYSMVVTVSRPEGSNATRREDNAAPGTSVQGLGATSLSEPGDYIFEIKNIGLQDLTGTLTVHEWWEYFERPWVFYGIALFLLALPYPLWILFRLFRERSISKSEVAS